MRSFDCGPNMASSASRLSAFNASTRALAASSSEANVFWAAWAGCSGAFWELVQAQKHRAIAKSTNAADHCATLGFFFVSIANLLVSLVHMVEWSGCYLRPPPPKCPPPHPPPPPRLPQPRELEERSPQ